MFNEEKFWSQVKKDSPNNCWLWQGSVLGHGYGYGGTPNPKHNLAHQVAYELKNGVVPPGYRFNACPHSRLCVNPDHITIQLKVTPIEERFWEKVNKESEYHASHMESNCWEWTGTQMSVGYGTIFIARIDRKFSDKRGSSGMLAHRYSWILHNGDIPDELHVLHRCDHRKCVRPDHLFTGTAKDNIHDCIKKGRRNDKGAVGERNAGAVLTADKVIAIRALAHTHSLSQLASMFNVTESAISHVKAHRSWKHIP